MRTWHCSIDTPRASQRGNHGSERSRVLHGVTRDLWQIVFDARVPPSAAASDQVSPEAGALGAVGCGRNLPAETNRHLASLPAELSRATTYHSTGNNYL